MSSERERPWAVGNAQCAQGSKPKGQTILIAKHGPRSGFFSGRREKRRRKKAMSSEQWAHRPKRKAISNVEGAEGE